MSKKVTRIYKNVWKPGAEDAAKKFGFIKAEEMLSKKYNIIKVSQIHL